MSALQDAWELFLVAKKGDIKKRLKERLEDQKMITKYHRFMEQVEVMDVEYQNDLQYKIVFKLDGRMLKFHRNHIAWTMPSSLFVEYGQMINHVSPIFESFVMSVPEIKEKDKLEDLKYELVSKRSVRIRKLKEMKDLFYFIRSDVPIQKWDKEIVAALVKGYPLGPVYFMNVIKGHEKMENHVSRQVIPIRGHEKLETMFSYLESGEEIKEIKKLWDYEVVTYEFDQKLSDIQIELVNKMINK